MSVYHDTGLAAIIDLSSYRVARKQADREIEREIDSEIDSELASSAGARACARTRTREGSGDNSDAIEDQSTANSAAIGRTTRNDDDVRGYHAMDETYSYYCDVFGRQRVAPSVRRDMVSAIDAGMEPAVLMAAMDAATQAAAPSWAYARAVIVRCLSEGVLTLDAYNARTAAHRASYQSRAGRGYAERKVTEDEFSSGFYVDVMARPGKDGKHGHD